MKLKVKNINLPPSNMLKVFTKYDDYPSTIKVPVMPLLKPVIRRRNTDVTAFYPFGEECYFQDYKIANIRMGLEDVKFITYKRAK